MSLQVSVIMLGVKDVERAKEFYVDGLGAEPTQDYPGFVRCLLGTGPDLALYEWSAVADDIGVPADGSGFRGYALHFIADSRAEVDAVMTAAADAGATVLKPAKDAEWGGYGGTFSDPDGHLWKVVTDA